MNDPFPDDRDSRDRTMGEVFAGMVGVLGRIFLLPVDVMFCLFDIFWVNLQKTRLFSEDCRGWRGDAGPCGPASKYTNRWLFRLVCPLMEYSDEEPHPACTAEGNPPAHLFRGLAVILAFLLTAMGAFVGFLVVRGRLEASKRATIDLDERAEACMRRGMDAFSQGSYRVAMQHFHSAYEAKPDDSEAIYRAALCLLRMGRRREGLRYLLIASAGDQAYPEAARRSALAVYRGGDVRLAGSLAERAIDLGLDDRILRAIIAVSRDRNGMGEAHGYLQKLMRGEPGSDEERVARAHVLIRRRRFDSAAELLGNVDQESECARAAGLARVHLLWARGEREDALNRARRLVQRYPNVPGSHTLLTELLLAAGETRAARERASEAHRLFRSEDWVQLRLARLLSRYGEIDHALGFALDLEQSRTIGKQATELVAELYLKAGLPLLASRHAERAVERAPDSPSAHLVAGKADRALGNHDRAVRRFERAVELEPAGPDVLLALGHAQLEAGNEERGLENLRRASELADSARFSYEYGAALVEAGRPREAEEPLRRAAAELTDSSAALTLLGEMARKRGDARDAMGLYARALRANSRAGVGAANNLAAMMLDEGGDPALALGLAMYAHFSARSQRLRAATADTLAQALIRTGHVARARHPARIAAQSLPHFQECQLRLGIAEAAAGNVEQAMAALKKAVRLGENTPAGVRAEKLLADLVSSRQAEPPRN
jgi:tetratricopeptide (TPR) repeat protein